MYLKDLVSTIGIGAALICSFIALDWLGRAADQNPFGPFAWLRLAVCALIVFPSLYWLARQVTTKGNNHD